MALPKVVVRGKQVILLSGYKKGGTIKKGCPDEMRPNVMVDAKDELALAAQRNPDAVAFGYVAGQWVASA